MNMSKDSMVILDGCKTSFRMVAINQPIRLTKFVAEHGHFGLDIVCMGQEFQDVHSLWRRRTERKIVFNKLSSLGSDKCCSAAFTKQFQTTCFKQKKSEAYEILPVLHSELEKHS